MVLALPDKWIWDGWYAHDGERYHAFFLQAPKSLGDPELRHWNVSYGHAISDDLTHWTHLGTCFAPAEGPAWDDYTTWTGSVLRDGAGLWHLFYTGTSQAENGLIQRIGHATSMDLHNWQRVGDGQCLDLSGDIYELETPADWHDRAMRDPWVMRDPSGEGWLMYFTARVAGTGETNARGAIGFATSADLDTWTLQAPVFVGGFGQLEVPQVLKAGDRWICLFCTADAHWSQACKAAAAMPPVTGTHYLIADDPRGPWSIAPGPFLDGSQPCKRYAARLVETPEGLKLLGFADRPTGGFAGHITDPDPVDIGPDGLLHVGGS
ncbi:MAG: levansucrase [Rhodobacter sp.]|nr:levansucrase [Rhodobacter sp.]